MEVIFPRIQVWFEKICVAANIIKPQFQFLVKCYIVGKYKEVSEIYILRFIMYGIFKKSHLNLTCTLTWSKAKIHENKLLYFQNNALNFKRWGNVFYIESFFGMIIWFKWFYHSKNVLAEKKNPVLCWFFSLPPISIKMFSFLEIFFLLLFISQRDLQAVVMVFINAAQCLLSRHSCSKSTMGTPK